MPLLFRSMFAINDINNGTLNATKAMPQKDLTSINENSFAMDRRNYIETLPSTNTTYLNPQKKWYGNRDASQVTTNRRVSNVGVGSLNANKNPLSFTTVKDVNTVNDALTRVRAGGSMVPPKVRAKTTNGLTPTWPIGKLVRTEYQTIQTIHNKMGLFDKPISTNVIKKNH